ncbi:MAG TPA: NFACT family protein, partial [Chthonomonadaceae bacterium]|nr:NFACT family protein [Chthonomonadaceae bacterium]
FDRILEIHIESRSDNAIVTACLIAELMGKHSNLILLAPDGVIVDAAKRIPRRINRVREVLPGLPYLPPPAPAPAERIPAPHAGISPFLARELEARAEMAATEGELEAGLQRAWEEVFGAAAQERYAPVLVRDMDGRLLGAYPFPLVQFPAEAQERVPEINGALDAAFTEIVARAEVEADRGQLRGRIQREQARRERQRQSAERTLEESERAEAHKQAGDLLLANLWRVQPGDSRVTVQDYYDPALPERALALDPKLTAQENAEAYFRRYRKARDGTARAAERREEALAALEALQQAQALLEAADTQKALQALQAELLESGTLRAPEEAEEAASSAGPDFQGHKIRRYQTPEGYDIYVGETATANDYLTTRVAAPNDLWLHVRAAASAHVVIRTQGRPEAVPQAVVERAALLCARHSSQKHSSLVPVDVTLRKYVRKPRGAAPGSVLVQREKTLHVTP